MHFLLTRRHTIAPLLSVVIACLIAAHVAAEEPVSTLSIDVDTGAYANMRRYLNSGSWPPQDAVRVEELVKILREDEKIL